MARQIMYDGGEYSRGSGDESSFLYLNVARIREVSIGPNPATDEGYTVSLSFDPGDYFTRDFTVEADAVAEAQIWIDRIERT